MGRKLKGKRLQDMLDKHWMVIADKDERGFPLPPAPTAEEFRVAVATHNAQYEAHGAVTPHLWDNGQDTRGPLQKWQDSFRHYSDSHQFNAEQWRRITQAATKPNTDWTCDAKDLTSCPVVGEPIVEVPRWMYEEWACLAGEVDTEWITYLVGTVHGKGAVIESFYFPPQLASGAHVAQPDESFRPQPRTIGATHSHVRMGAFWSKTDEDHANWPVEIVINARAESKCRVRLQLECHRYARIDAKIKLTGTWQRPSTWRDALQAALQAGEQAREAAKALAASQATAPASASPISTATQPTSANDSVETELGHFGGHFWGGRGGMA